VGNVLINFRTYPIRVHSHKYFDSMGKCLTSDQVKSMPNNDVIRIEGYSGDFYPDSEETSWDELNLRDPNTGERIVEQTSVTKLVRRVATFSPQNMLDAIKFNLPPEGYKVFLSINFMNYIDSAFYGVSTKQEFIQALKSSEKSSEWIKNNILTPIQNFSYRRWISSSIIFGTGADDAHLVSVSLQDLEQIT
jgi:hypothetical protein